MHKFDPHPDVLVMGEHPAAYLVAVLLRAKTKLTVLHATIPAEQIPDRLVLVNPEFFDLHPLLSPLRRKLDLSGAYGLRFLADDPAVHCEFRSKSAISLVGSYRDMRAALVKLAEAEGVEMTVPRELEILALDETGVDVKVGKTKVRATALVVAGHLPAQQQRLLGLPEEWESDVLHRYTFARLKRGATPDAGNRPMIHMSLDLKGTLCWAWLLSHGATAQLCVVEPIESARRRSAPLELVAHWVTVLRSHGVLKEGPELPVESVDSMNLPLAGAMAHEGVANRTLLVGPAGGFYSACSEDIYPNCWSALFAADAMRKALNEPHLQDGLQVYRHKWRTTLGDYLRGPQQNLRFLLPLVYRNPVMTARLSESILLGKSVVR